MVRKEKLVAGGFFHIFNRGVEKRRIFLTEKDYQRFQVLIFYYQLTNKKFTDSGSNIDLAALTKPGLDLGVGFEKPVELISYCLMPNHFHLLLKQLTDTGTTDYLHRIATSYTKYFNIRNERVGPLLQGRFKSVRVVNQEQLIYVSKYIHRNPWELFPEKSAKTDLTKYSYSSLPDYLGKRTTCNNWLSTGYVLDSFTKIESYQSLVLEEFDKREIDGLRVFDREMDQTLSNY